MFGVFDGSCISIRMYLIIIPCCFSFRGIYFINLITKQIRFYGCKFLNIVQRINLKIIELKLSVRICFTRNGCSVKLNRISASFVIIYTECYSRYFSCIARRIYLVYQYDSCSTIFYRYICKNILTIINLIKSIGIITYLDCLGSKISFNWYFGSQRSFYHTIAYIEYYLPVVFTVFCLRYVVLFVPLDFKIQNTVSIGIITILCRIRVDCELYILNRCVVLISIHLCDCKF